MATARALGSTGAPPVVIDAAPLTDCTLTVQNRKRSTKGSTPTLAPGLYKPPLPVLDRVDLLIPVVLMCVFLFSDVWVTCNNTTF